MKKSEVEKAKQKITELKKKNRVLSLRFLKPESTFEKFKQEILDYIT
jgi:hypothetical protein